MNLLLDTHALLWWLTADDRLSSAAVSAISAADKVFVSAVTAWEIATKQRLGKLPEAEPYVSNLHDVVLEEGMKLVPLAFRHGLRAGAYPAFHRDPFDRMLAAQAELEGLTLITRDKQFVQFPIQTLW